MNRKLEVLEGVVLLGIIAGVLAFVFPIHERLYAWPFVALAAWGWGVLLTAAFAIRLVLGPRQIVVKVVV